MSRYRSMATQEDNDWNRRARIDQILCSTERDVCVSPEEPVPKLIPSYFGLHLSPPLENHYLPHRQVIYGPASRGYESLRCYGSC